MVDMVMAAPCINHTQSVWISLYNTQSVCESKGKSFANKCEAAGKEEEDESREVSQAFLLLGKDPEWPHLQVFGKAKRGGDDQRRLTKPQRRGQSRCSSGLWD